MAVSSFALHDLGWHAFQQLCHTILREVLGQGVVAFLDTNDGGRDGAFTGTWMSAPGESLEGQFVVQCKHTARPNATISLSSLEDEFDKAERLVNLGRCDTYLLMTNAGITGASELEIEKALKDRGVKHVRVLGATWINQTIAESSRLRRLVPRLYGLGDLTEILDDRAYRQARAVLDAMRPDLNKLVMTSTYEKAARALDEHGFVLLVGAAATGKTTIAAQLALGAADEFRTAVVKIDSVSNLQDRWNPDERQLFWLDDAFGATQFERHLAMAWTTAVARVEAAIQAGSRFILTSRDYVFSAARGYLKPGSFPRLLEAQVVVDVAALGLEERRQILYNHLRHGRQPDSFLTALSPHLEATARNRAFTPELGRRLGDPAFTRNLDPANLNAVADFFARPNDFMSDVMTGLDADARAALGLIFVHRNWLPSPVSLEARDRDLVERLGSSLGGVTSALDALRGSLVEHIVRDEAGGWVFAHPTMADAYANLLRSPELQHHFLVGSPLAALLHEITCGDVGIEGAIIVPPERFGLVATRLSESSQAGGDLWRDRSRRVQFLSTRCNEEFLRAWLAHNPGRLARLADPGLMLESDPHNELFARLNHLGLVPEPLRREFAQSLIEYCVTGVDPAVLWDEQLSSVLTASEHQSLLRRVYEELLTDLPNAVSESTEGWSEGDDPESFAAPLRDLSWQLPRLFPGDDFVAAKAQELDNLLDEWVGAKDHGPSYGDDPERWSTESPAPLERLSHQARSVFDDLLEGRSSVQPGLGLGQ